MAVELTPEERETHLSMSGDNHDEWEVFTDDPYWIRRLEKLGIQPVMAIGSGFRYKLRADQVFVRKGKKQVSEAQRERMRQNAHFGGKNPSSIRENDRRGVVTA